MAYRVQGVAAEVRWGYYRAATLGAWTIEDQVLRATATAVDTFRVAQQPLDLVVGERRWPLETLEIVDHRVTGRVRSGG